MRIYKRRLAFGAGLAALAACMIWPSTWFLPVKRVYRAGMIDKPGTTTTILLVGTDRPGKIPTGEFGVRTDVLILANCDTQRNRVTLLSIPRDTIVNLPGHGKDRINLANVYGGMAMTRLMVENLTGLRVDRYATIDYQAFSDLIDMFGGIEIDVDKRMYYRDTKQDLLIDLQKGRQVLTGKQALGFVRYRRDPLGDINRVQRQQRLLKAIMSKARKQRLWTKLIPLYRLQKRYIQTDLNMFDLFRLRGFISSLASSDRMVTFTVPGFFSGPLWAPDEKALSALIKKEFAPPVTFIKPKKQLEDALWLNWM